MHSKSSIKFLILFSLFLSLTLAPIFLPIGSKAAQAQSLEDTEKRLQDIQTQIDQLSGQLDQAKGQEKTLKSQLTVIDTQTQITTLKIEEATGQIAKLDREITDLSGRIDRLSTTVDSLSQVLLNRIVETYKYGNFATLDLLFSSNGFSDLLLRTKYIQVAQENDKKVLYQLQATKAAYNDQKNDKQTRQTQEEQLKKDLDKYQTQLDQQKKAKEDLLRATQNDESKFQSLIAQLQAEQDSIAKAIGNIGVTIGNVSKGQQIAAMGSTGCSTGPHLHFEVYENAKVQNGSIVDKNTGNPVSSNVWNYLRDPSGYINGGPFGPPLKGYPSETVITTGFGEQYFLGKHTGLDIAPAHYEGVGRPIQAAADGVAYSTSAPCNYPQAGGTPVGKGVIVDHQNGLVTLYWHVL